MRQDGAAPQVVLESPVFFSSGGPSDHIPLWFDRLGETGAPSKCSGPEETKQGCLTKASEPKEAELNL